MILISEFFFYYFLTRFFHVIRLYDYQLFLVLDCVFLYFFIFTFAGTFLLQFNPKHYSQITLHLSTCISEQSDSSLKSKPCTTLFGIKFLNYYYHLISSLLRIQLSCKIQTFHILRQSTRKFKPTHILYPFTTSVGLMIGIFLSITILQFFYSDVLCVGSNLHSAYLCVT